jgi:hypothetical protein
VAISAKEILHSDKSNLGFLVFLFSDFLARERGHTCEGELGHTCDRKQKTIHTCDPYNPYGTCGSGRTGDVSRMALTSASHIVGLQVGRVFSDFC